MLQISIIALSCLIYVIETYIDPNGLNAAWVVSPRPDSILMLRSAT
jgi:hypothetical protein